MDKKKKFKKSNIPRKTDGKTISTSTDKSASSSAGIASPELQSANDSNKSKIFWKKHLVLLTISAITIVVFIIGGTLTLQRAAKERASSDITPALPSQSTLKIEIRDVEVTDVTDKSLTVRWKTNVPATSELTAYEQNGSNPVGSWPDSKLVLEHKIILEKLAPATYYTLKIKSKDAAGNETVFESASLYKTRAPILTIGITPGQTSPAFSLKSITGETITLADYPGKKITLVFWMMSCSACRDELPYLRDFWDSSQHDDLVLLAINIGENENLVKNYAMSQKLTFPVLLDQDKAFTNKYTIIHYPTIILLGTDKTVKKIREEPFKNVGEIEDFVRSPN